MNLNWSLNKTNTSVNAIRLCALWLKPPIWGSGLICFSLSMRTNSINLESKFQKLTRFSKDKCLNWVTILLLSWLPSKEHGGDSLPDWVQFNPFGQKALGKTETHPQRTFRCSEEKEGHPDLLWLFRGEGSKNLSTIIWTTLIFQDLFCKPSENQEKFDKYLSLNPHWWESLWYLKKEYINRIKVESKVK